MKTKTSRPMTVSVRVVVMLVVLGMSEDDEDDEDDDELGRLLEFVLLLLLLLLELLLLELLLLLLLLELLLVVGVLVDEDEVTDVVSDDVVDVVVEDVEAWTRRSAERARMAQSGASRERVRMAGRVFFYVCAGRLSRAASLADRRWWWCAAGRARGARAFAEHLPRAALIYVAAAAAVLFP